MVIIATIIAMAISAEEHLRRRLSEWPNSDVPATADERSLVKPISGVLAPESDLSRHNHYQYRCPKPLLPTAK